MSGLVLVLAMSFVAISPAESRATLIAYFFASDLIVLTVLLLRGEVDAELFWRIVFGVPLLVVGILIGSKAFRRASAESFRRVTLGLLVGISIVGLLRLAVA